MTDSFTIRRATLDDVPTILFQRRSMFTEMGSGTEDAIDIMSVSFEPWLREKIQADRYIGWFAVNETGEVIAGAGVWLMDWPPTVIEPSSLRAYMLNVFTHTGYRKRGLAHALTQTVIEWCRNNNRHLLVLHASNAGRPVYESMGFELSNEMKLIIR